MRDAIAFVRSVVFTIVFFTGTALYVATALCALRFGDGPFARVALGWARFHRRCARWILGQRVVVDGPVPDAPRFCVLKHEAMFETIDLPLVIGARPIVAAKQELNDIPLWGRTARAYGLVGVDRDAGAGALRQLRRDALAAMALGRPLCLFAEGTRVPHGQTPPLKSGFAGLYTLLRVPVIPVATDSGRLNPRGRFIRYPGIIRFRFGAPIPPGLDRREAEAMAHRAINALNATDQPSPTPSPPPSPPPSPTPPPTATS